MIDTHCHVDFKDFNKDRDEVIKDCKTKLSSIINSGTNYEGNKSVLKLSKKENGFIYPSFGFHPMNKIKTREEIKKVKNDMVDHLDDIVAIGEVGMDYYYVKDKQKREKQNSIFESFAQLCDEYQIPLLIHGRDCEKKIYPILLKYKSIPEVIYHCYSGSLKTAQKLVDENYYISMSTMLCYSKHHQELLEELPLTNILTETDSPYLAPERNTRNDPRNIEKVIEKISKIKDISPEKVDKITTKNAKKVFKL